MTRGHVGPLLLLCALGGLGACKSVEPSSARIAACESHCLAQPCVDALEVCEVVWANCARTCRRESPRPLPPPWPEEAPPLAPSPREAGGMAGPIEGGSLALTRDGRWAIVADADRDLLWVVARGDTRVGPGRRIYRGTSWLSDLDGYLFAARLAASDRLVVHAPSDVVLWLRVEAVGSSIGELEPAPLSHRHYADDDPVSLRVRYQCRSRCPVRVDWEVIAASMPTTVRGADVGIEVEEAPHRAHRRVDLHAGDRPFRFVEDDAGRVHVTLSGGGAVVSLDPASGEILRRPVCAAPRGIDYDDTADVLHVACAGGELVTLPAAGGAPVRVLELDPDLRDVVVSEDRLFVSRFRVAEVLELDRDGALVARLGPGPHELRNDDRIPRTFTAANAYRLARDGSGGLLLLHQWARAGSVFPSTDQNGCDAIVMAGLTRLWPGFGDVGHFSVPVRDVLVDMDDRVFLGATGLWDLTLPRGEELACRDSLARLSEGAGAIGVAHAIDATGEPVLYTLASEPSVLRYEWHHLALPGAAILDRRGLERFYARGRTQSCASCHPGGSDDGRVWDFVGVGPRRTLGLRGALVEGAALGWEGLHADLGAYLDATHRSFLGETSAEAVDELTAWIRSLPPIRTRAPDPETAEAGEALLAELGCTSCHAGLEGTDFARHDVGTGGAWRTAPLRGLTGRAPYLHDGRAVDLEAVFALAEDAGGPHDLSTLDDEARALVVEHLSSR